MKKILMKTAMNKILIAAALAAIAPAARADKVQLAIVVDKDNPRSEITLEELRAIFLGKQKEWGDGTRIVPLDLEPGSGERELFNAQVLEMEQGEVDRFWVDQKMRGSSGAPRVAPAAGAVVKLAGRIRGVIGYVPAGSADGSVKILKVDGVLPGKPGYRVAGK
jgi:ABC-type phosphate transport system substrate-binding protein